MSADRPVVERIWLGRPLRRSVSFLGEDLDDAAHRLLLLSGLLQLGLGAFGMLLLTSNLPLALIYMGVGVIGATGVFAAYRLRAGHSLWQPICFVVGASGLAQAFWQIESHGNVGVFAGSGVSVLLALLAGGVFVAVMYGTRRAAP